jgi:nucleoside-diphosphate-sugar epimerase
MNALVTGGGGFLGRWLVEKLRARGDTVRVIGRREYPDLAQSGVDTVQADISDQTAVAAACKDIDAVFHAASRVGVWGRRRDFYSTNVEGTNNVLEACRVAGVKRLVYTSSPSVVFGRDSIAGGDESLPYPDSYLAVYPETKAIAERSVIEASGTDGLLTCSLRPHLIWGPGDTNLVPRMVARSKSGRLARVGDGTNRVSVAYVENAADAHLLACDRLVEGSPVPGQCYFIAEPEPVNCWDFIGDLLVKLDCQPVKKSVSTKAAYAIGTVMELAYGLFGVSKEPAMTRFTALQLATDHWFDISKAQRDLGWESRVTIDEGIERLNRSG